MKKKKQVLVGSILFIFCLIAGGAFVASWRLYENGKQVFNLRSNQVSSLMQSNPEFFLEIFDQIMPRAGECGTDPACVENIRNELDLLTAKAGTTSAETKPDYFSNVSLANDQPMYFISLSNNKFNKLFFSGEYFVDQVETRREKMVQDVLLGKREQLYGFQANVDGLRMTYLNDLYSEAEVIVPFKQNDEIVGAVVYLHGD